MTTTPMGSVADALPESPITFIDFLLDETGSMTSCHRETCAGFDNYIVSQRDVSGECYLTLVKFNTNVTTVPFENLSLGMVPKLSFYPQGGTNLYDCIVDRIETILAAPVQGQSLFVIMTDGEDLHSRRHNLATTRDAVMRAQDAGIVVVYLGPSHTALKVGHDLGIPEGNVKSFDTSNMAETMQTLNRSTTAFRAGTTASTAFFN